MSTQKIKELKDDALLSVKVNKTYYLMCKASLYTVFTEIHDSSVKPDDFVKSIITKDYNDMSDKERLFYTLTLLIGEIEKQAVEQDALIEKDLDLEKVKEDLDKIKSNED